MAGKKRPKLRPIGTLSRKQRERRRFARSLGMKDEHQLNRLVVKLHNLPESDPRHLRENLPRDRFESTIQRLYRKDKKTLTPWKEIIRKKEILVDELKTMSNFTFYEAYKSQISAALENPNLSAYGRKQLLELQRTLLKRSYLPSEMKPTKTGQGRLF